MKKVVLSLTIFIFVLGFAPAYAMKKAEQQTVCGAIKQLQESLKNMELRITDRLEKLDTRIGKIEERVECVGKKVEDLRFFVGSFDAEENKTIDEKQKDIDTNEENKSNSIEEKRQIDSCGIEKNETYIPECRHIIEQYIESNKEKYEQNERNKQYNREYLKQSRPSDTKNLKEDMYKLKYIVFLKEVNVEVPFPYCGYLHEKKSIRHPSVITTFKKTDYWVPDKLAEEFIKKGWAKEKS